MPRKPQSIADKLRKAIARAERQGMSRASIARAAGVPHSTVVEFCNTPGRQLRLDIAERVAEALGGRLRFDP